ncbi:hypothetical protein [uncultured Sporomusa sp.]|uniref:hypothetical protein n=1 Tax=uncultured Sporomusa sp. TaxID=307249 RepID=UPI0025850D50|nr:hypothetical protein [uncultured Sporomusa sp.]
MQKFKHEKITGGITMGKTMFTAKEAVTEYFQGTISYWKLLDDFKKGKIPGSRVGSRRIIFRKEALDNWMESMENESMPPSKPKHIYEKVNRF